MIRKLIAAKVSCRSEIRLVQRGSETPVMGNGIVRRNCVRDSCSSSWESDRRPGEEKPGRSPGGNVTKPSRRKNSEIGTRQDVGMSMVN